MKAVESSGWVRSNQFFQGIPLFTGYSDGTGVTIGARFLGDRDLSAIGRRSGLRQRMALFWPWKSLCSRNCWCRAPTRGSNRRISTSALWVQPCRRLYLWTISYAKITGSRNLGDGGLIGGRAAFGQQGERGRAKLPRLLPYADTRQGGPDPSNVNGPRILIRIFLPDSRGPRRTICPSIHALFERETIRRERAHWHARPDRFRTVHG